jgi:hypothetical protein
MALGDGLCYKHWVPTGPYGFGDWKWYKHVVPPGRQRSLTHPIQFDSLTNFARLLVSGKQAIIGGQYLQTNGQRYDKIISERIFKIIIGKQ